jgi:PmbA protein
LLRQKAIDLVQNHPQVQDWSVREVDLAAHELFLVRDKQESQRAVETRRATVEIHRDLTDAEGQPKRGSSHFTLLSDDSDSGAQQKLEKAVFAAGLALNPPYVLPAPSSYPDLDIRDTALATAPQDALEDLGARFVAQLAREHQVEPSSAEFFAHEITTHLINSRGLEAHKQETRLFVEMVVLSCDGAQESEFFDDLEGRALQDLDLEEEVARCARSARDSLHAGAPATRSGPVAITGRALIELLAFLRYASAGSMKYQQMTQWEVGKPITGDLELLGEPLTLVADALLPRGAGSTPFDRDGLPGQQTTLVEEGIFRQYWADYRHAQYLDTPATGAFGNLSIPAGRTPVSDLLARDRPLFQIVSFAAMDPDPITGQFVGEIRLGYDLSTGDGTPFKGGAISGDMTSALANVRFSREGAQWGDYHGPQFALFGDLKVGGGS